nr:small heat shock protein sHsp17.6 [Dinophyceae sp.]
MWQRVKLPVRFESGEGRRSYEVAARISGLETENVALKLNDDHTALTISGVRVPNAMQQQRLQHELVQRLGGAPPSALATPEELFRAYATIGHGKFGYFEETFRLPHDVNTSAVQAEYVDGVLRVILPKIIQRRSAVPLYSARRRPDAFPGFGGFGYF